jgi:hypothetical protein
MKITGSPAASRRSGPHAPGNFARSLISRYLALSGGLITGILAPLSGGGTLISESCPAGGQITPFEPESLRPSSSPLLPLSAGVHCCCDEEGGEGGGGVCASAIALETSESAAASPLSSFPADRA